MRGSPAHVGNTLVAGPGIDEIDIARLDSLQLLFTFGPFRLQALEPKQGAANFRKQARL
jgi:hypothetical protein